MKEYIDRNALLKDICGNDPSRMEDYYYNAIANAPAADVVEVVRCKDCKYYKLYHLACVYPHHNGVISVDGFCSYGERKEQE